MENELMNWFIQYLNEYLYLGDMNKALQNHFFI